MCRRVKKLVTSYDDEREIESFLTIFICFYHYP